jgi:hypothetical protein
LNYLGGRKPMKGTHDGQKKQNYTIHGPFGGYYWFDNRMGSPVTGFVNRVKLIRGYTVREEGNSE